MLVLLLLERIRSESYEISWIHISLHMANPGPNPNASEIVTAVHL